MRQRLSGFTTRSKAERHACLQHTTTISDAACGGTQTCPPPYHNILPLLSLLGPAYWPCWKKETGGITFTREELCHCIRNTSHRECVWFCPTTPVSREHAQTHSPSGKFLPKNMSEPLMTPGHADLLYGHMWKDLYFCCEPKNLCPLYLCRVVTFVLSWLWNPLLLVCL